MRVLVCPQSFTGTLTAVQAAEAMASGWRRRAPHDEVTTAPLSDGGPGFVHVVETALGGLSVGVTVSDALGREVPASVLVVEAAGRRTAYVEAAQAAGLHLLEAHERDPEVTSSAGVGALVGAALAEGATRIVVGTGGLATNDGGAGFLAALGAGDPDDLQRGGGALGSLPDEALLGLRDAKARLHGVELVLATESRTPLLGFSGTSATRSARKGASPKASQRLEGALGRFTDVANRALPSVPDLMTGLPRRLDREPGAGAGGGLGYALLLLGAARVSAVDLVLDAWGVEDLLARHDLVLTGQGCLDWEALRDSVVAGVSAITARRGLPAVVLAGQVLVGRRETMSAGIAGAYAVVDGRVDVAAAMADPVGTLAARAERLAGTWSPG